MLLLTEIPVPEPIQPYMPLIVGVATALLIFVVGWLASKWTHKLVAKLMRRRAIDESLVRFMAALAQFMVLAVTLITALARVGVETTSFVALLGSAGIAIGLALQGNLAHFASGVMLLVFRPFTVGDLIEGGGKSGIVEEVGLFATSLTTPENNRVLVPNGAITGAAITNFTKLGKRRARLDVKVAYATDVSQMVELLVEAAKSCPDVLGDPAPEAALAGVSGAALEFSLLFWATNANFGPVQHQVRVAVYDRLNAAKIEAK